MVTNCVGTGGRLFGFVREKFLDALEKKKYGKIKTLNVREVK